MTHSRTAAVVVAALIVLAAAPAARAADGGGPLKLLIGGGFTSGGDNLVGTALADGSTPEMKAGRGLQAYAGGEYWITEPLAVQMTIGFQFDRRKVGGGNLMFQRFPLEVMGLYAITNNLRLGAGAQVVFGARLRGSGDAASLSQSYKHSTGRVIEGEFLITPHTAVKLRHVSEKFTAGDGAPKIKGDHVGVMFSYYF